MSSLVGSLAASSPVLPTHAAVVDARHEPPWATAAAVEEALLGAERLHRTAHRLRSQLHELRVGAVPPQERWRDRWRRADPGRPVVVRHAQDLDPETVGMLAAAAVGLGHDVHLVFDQVPSHGPSRSLAERLGVRAAEPIATPAVVVLPTDPRVRLVLRAAAGFPSPFDVERVAGRLGLASVRVLEHLQLAVEAGFPLADHGAGQLSMPEEARLALAEGLLPSLQEAWARRAAPRPAEPVPAAPLLEETPPPERPVAPPGEAEARVRAARDQAERPENDAVQQGRALLELSRSLRARPGLGVRLQEASDAARQAVELLAEGDVHERATARLTLAHLLVEHGHPASLDEALDQVVAASRELMDSGDAESAATLLNDQAEVWLKLGDPVRAAHLLHAAEEGLEGRHDAVAAIERAETAHLLARLPLYTRARPGQEADALSRALEHLAGAERTYARAGWVDRHAHTLDTRGRLLARAGRGQEAARALQEAAELYRRIGDGLGLARVTEGLAVLWAEEGQHRRAAALLEQSAVLNLAAASPAGLAHVRRASEKLPDGPLREQLEARLAEAEAAVGVATLPPAP